MPDVQNTQPAILISGFDGEEACVSMASVLLQSGLTVIAACVPGGTAAANVALGLGCAIVNADKEQAVRAGMEYFLKEMNGLPGLVLLDMEDGYSIEDVLHVAQALHANPDKLVIASRARNKNLGLLARLERSVAYLAFAAMHGRPVKDPWASLRALPSCHVAEFLDLQGSGHKFEFNMLVNLQHKGVRAVNVPVSVAYSMMEKSGFWDKAADIMKILLLPLKFISASVVATLADNTVYLIITRLLLPGHWIIALTACQSTGALTGYLLNRSVVFKTSNNTLRKEVSSAVQFTLLALFNYGASLLLIGFLHKTLLINDFISKLMSDAFLFIFSYTVQREFVFRRGIPSGKK